jgi:hypothetical protein
MTQRAIEKQVFDPETSFSKEKIRSVIDAMIGMDVVDPPVDHKFADGVYCRTMKIGAGVMVVGKVHKTQHLNIISRGVVHVRIGDSLQTIVGPHIFVSEAGAQKIVFAETATIWTTVHVTNETDIEKIQDQTVEPMSDDHLLELKKKGLLL